MDIQIRKPLRVPVGTLAEDVVGLMAIVVLILIGLSLPQFM